MHLLRAMTQVNHGAFTSKAMCYNICLVLSRFKNINDNNNSSPIISSRTAKKRAPNSLTAVGLQTDLYNSAKYIFLKAINITFILKEKYEMQSPDKMLIFSLFTRVSSSFCDLSVVIPKQFVLQHKTCCVKRQNQELSHHARILTG